MDWKLELIVVPVSDVERAKAFYMEKAGFELHVDHSEGDFRVVQLTPKGSACSIAIMANEAAGSLHGLHLVVSDIDAARDELELREPARAASSILRLASNSPEPIPAAPTTTRSARSTTLTATPGSCRR